MFTMFCNQGLKSVWISKVNGSSYQPMPNDTFTFASNEGGCLSTTASLTTNYLIFGQSSAFSGSSGSAGPALRAGILAAFGAVNAAGGIYGHRLLLWSLDDNYTVENAFSNSQAFISRGGIGLIGYYGTSIADNISVVAEQAKIGFFAPYTGSITVRDFALQNRFTINVRASYRDELHAFVKFMASTLSISSISIIYQNDDFGFQGMNALVDAMKAVNLRVMSNGSYAANTINIQAGLDAIITNASPFFPQAVFVWAVAKAAAAFINQAKFRLPPETVYFCVSAAAGEGFVSQLAINRENIYVSQVLPLVNDLSFPIVESYRQDMSAYNPIYLDSMVSFEAYVNAELVINALREVPPEKIRSAPSLIDSFYATRVFSVDKLVFGPYTSTCNQGLKSVWISKISGSSYQPMPNDTFTFTTSESGCMSTTASLTTNYLIFGQSSAFSGPSETVGPSLRAGILAAFGGVNAAGGIYGHRLKLMSLDDGYNASKAIENTNILIENNVFGLIGFYGTAIANAVAPISSAARIPFLGPVTGTTTIREASDVVNLRASYVDEVNGLIHFACSLRGLTRISIFYQDDSFGQQGLSATVTALGTIGLKLLSNGTYTVNSEDVTTGFQRIVIGSAPLIPQAILVWAPSSMAVRFITHVKANWPLGRKLFLLCPSVVGEVGFLADANDSTVTMFVSQVLPPISSTAYPVVQQYGAAIGTGPRNSFSFEGYVLARLVIEVLQRMPPDEFRSSSRFTNELYDERLFVVGSLNIGPYERGLCNQGLRKIWIGVCTNGSIVEIPDAAFAFPDECISTASTNLHQPLTFGFLYAKNSSVNANHIAGLRSAFQDMNSDIGGSKTHYIYLIEIPILSSNSEAIKLQLEPVLNDADFAGFVTNIRDLEMLTTISTLTAAQKKLLISIPGPPTRLPFSPYRIFMGGTLKDEAFAIVRYLANELGLTRIGLIYEKNAFGQTSMISEIVESAASEYHCLLAQSAQITFDSNISAIVDKMLLAAAVEAVLISSSTFATDTILRIKQQRPSFPVFVFSSDASSLEMRRNVPKSYYEGLFVSRFVPEPFSNTSTLSSRARTSMVRHYNASMSPSFSFEEGYLAGIFIDEVIGQFRSRLVEPATFREMVFSSSEFKVEISLGPFADETCLQQTEVTVSSDCVCDLGARMVWLNRFATDDRTPFEDVLEAQLHFDTCEVMSTLRNNTIITTSSSGVSVYTIIAIIVSILVFSGGAIAGWMLCARRRRKLAAMMAAPKGQVTIVFTDVQDSTHLWDVCPKMFEALETHNEVMRDLIDKYNGYEVKTQGDSFMVAFQEPSVAVAWSLHVQEALLEVPWPDDILAQKSCEVVFAKESSDTNGEPLLLFRGLRVRIGIHTGYPQLEYNPRTGGIDYFGPTVNCAARVESLGAGGQVLCSLPTQAALNEKGCDELIYKFMGKFPLKGISGEQDIIQISNARLNERQFADIDRSKLESSSKSQGACENCNRPLVCPRCHKIAILPRRTSEGKSMASSVQNTMKSPVARLRKPTLTSASSFSDADNVRVLPLNDLQPSLSPAHSERKTARSTASSKKPAGSASARNDPVSGRKTVW